MEDSEGEMEDEGNGGGEGKAARRVVCRPINDGAGCDCIGHGASAAPFKFQSKRGGRFTKNEVPRVLREDPELW